MDYSDSTYIDLHIHSSASDGSLSPVDIMDMAVRLGLKAFSITDHDTTDGVANALAAGVPEGLDFVTGVEISVNPPPSAPVTVGFHILGYNFDIDDPDIKQALAVLKTARENRNPKIIDRLNQLGISITLADAALEAGDGLIGRPHIAKALVRHGHVASFEEAFDRFLATGKPAYVEKYRMFCEDAIRLIKKAGGIPVLAHPSLISVTGDQQESIKTLVRLLTEMGLAGIEIYYTEHSQSDIAFYQTLAEEFSLKVTGGTDFHGSIKPAILMGTGKGDLFVPYSVYEQLLADTPLFEDIGESPGFVVAYANLEKKIGYQFDKITYLEEALRHSSFANESEQEDLTDNERLEFLGDAVLNLAVGHLVMALYPGEDEGVLSKARSELVNELHLADIARTIDLGKYIQLGRGEIATQGHKKSSILADTFEALIAAIYMDGGFDAAFNFIERYFLCYIGGNVSIPREARDYKSKIQEYAQSILKVSPKYRVIDQTGPHHDRTFTVQLTVGEFSAQGTGKSKKKAEQSSAYNMLSLLPKSEDRS